MLRVDRAADGKGKRLTTTVAIAQGTAFHSFRHHRTATVRTYTSVQVGIDRSIEEFFLAHLNHSCDPNVIVDAEKQELRAIRNIQPGEDLTFFYPSTEWEMAEPFGCLCGAAECMGTISGARDLSLSMLGRYFINRHIAIMAMEHLLCADSVNSAIAA